MYKKIFIIFSLFTQFGIGNAQYSGITLEPPAPDTTFGEWNLAISDNYAFISQLNFATDDYGVTHIFKRTNNTWKHNQILTDNSAWLAPISRVSDLNILIAGLRLDNSGVFPLVVPYVAAYRLEGEFWVPYDTLEVSNQGDPPFPPRVLVPTCALNGDYAIVASQILGDEIDRVHIFRRSSDQWQELGSRNTGDEVFDIALSENYAYIAVGSLGNSLFLKKSGEQWIDLYVPKDPIFGDDLYHFSKVDMFFPYMAAPSYFFRIERDSLHYETSDDFVQIILDVFIHGTRAFLATDTGALVVDRIGNEWVETGSIIPASPQLIIPKIDFSGTYGLIGNQGSVYLFGPGVTGVEIQGGENPIKPESFYLSQNHPNPFNGATAILYEITETTHVQLSIYDFLGKKIATLLNDVQAPGSYRINWNSIDQHGKIAPSGIYFYELRANRGGKQIRKMLLLK